MKVMVIVKANADSEAGRMPSEQELSEMGAFNEQLVAAGIMLAGEGLHATQRGRRIHFGGGGTQGRGRSVRSCQRTDRRLLAVGGALAGRGRRMGQPCAVRQWRHAGTASLISAEDFGEAFTPNYSSRNSVCVHSWKVDPIHLPPGTGLP
jgi:hypothetical protein